MSMGPGTLNALLVDVRVGHARARIVEALEDAGWTVHAVPVDGAEALIAALQRRGWDVVLYGGEGAARRAVAQGARARADSPTRTSRSSVSRPHVRPGDLSAFVQGFGPEAIVAPDPAQLPDAARAELEAAHDARPARRRAPAAARPAGDHRPPRRRPRARRALRAACWPRSASRSAGPAAPSGARAAAPSLRCAATWHDAGRAGPRSRPSPPRASGWRSRRPRARRAACGRSGARPGSPTCAPTRTRRGTPTPRAGLVTAVAFPIALGDECVGVIEFYAADAARAERRGMAMFATVGGQLAQYLERRRLQADEVRELEAELAAERARADRLGRSAGRGRRTRRSRLASGPCGG